MERLSTIEDKNSRHFGLTSWKPHIEENGKMGREQEISPQQIRLLILEMAKRANVGHIGSALSIADIIAALYGNVLRVVYPDASNRDRLVLSKGHAAMALYAALYLKGWLTKETLDTYCQNPSSAWITSAIEIPVISGQCPVTSKDSVSTDHWQQATGHCLGVHAEHNIPGVDFSTGSLGHGLSIGAGAALAARLDGSSRRVFVLLSDAECNEGSIWEAVMFAAHHRLSNLVAIVDLNGQQAFGYTDDVLSLSPMWSKWEAFGWNVHEVDGHNVTEITKTIEILDSASSQTSLDGKSSCCPHVLIAHTTFGKGVPYMENQIKWHYLPMSDDEYRQAVEAVENGEEKQEDFDITHDLPLITDDRDHPINHSSDNLYRHQTRKVSSG